MNTKQLQFEQKYRAAKYALQELIDSSKTIDGISVNLDENRKVVLMLDIWATAEIENQKIVRKVYAFIPDFELEERMDD